MQKTHFSFFIFWYVENNGILTLMILRWIIEQTNLFPCHFLKVRAFASFLDTIWTNSIWICDAITRMIVFLLSRFLAWLWLNSRLVQLFQYLFLSGDVKVFKYAHIMVIFLHKTTERKRSIFRVKHRRKKEDVRITGETLSTEK